MVLDFPPLGPPLRTTWNIIDLSSPKDSPLLLRTEEERLLAELRGESWTIWRNQSCNGDGENLLPADRAAAVEDNVLVRLFLVLVMVQKHH